MIKLRLFFFVVQMLLLLMSILTGLTLFSEGVGVTGLELDLVDGEGGGGAAGGVICWLLLTV